MTDEPVTTGNNALATMLNTIEDIQRLIFDLTIPPTSASPVDQDSSLTDLAIEFGKLREVKDLVDQLSTRLNKRFDYLRINLIPAKFDDAGITMIKVDNVGRINLRPDIYASIRTENREDAYQWLKDNGREDLVKENVNAATLKASLKKMIEQGEEFPSHLFKVTPYTMAVLTKA